MKVSVFLLTIVLVIQLVSAGASGFSKITIVSDFSGLDCSEGCWVFDWTDDGHTTDRISASWSADNIEDQSGYRSEQGITIDIDGTDNYCQYDIKREADRIDIFTIDIIERKEEYWAWEYNEAELKERVFTVANEMGCMKMDEYPGGLPGFLFTNTGFLHDTVEVVCYKQRSMLGKIGSIRNLKYISETDWSVEVEGKLGIEKSISNDVCSEEKEFCEGKTTTLGEDVIVQWVGQLSSGDTCPIATEELMAYDNDFTGNWQVIDRGNYYDYERYMKANLDALAKSVYEGGYTISGAEVIVNGKAAEAIEKRDFSTFNVDIISSTLDNGRLKIDLDNQIRFPTFRVIVDSDYLELLLPVGEPKLSKTLMGACLPSSKISFKEGEPGKLTITANNVGDGEGGFNVRIVSCDSGFGAGDTEGFTLPAGTSKTITLQTSAEVGDDKLIGKCLIEMKETLTQQIDTCYVNLEATAPAECVEGNIWCGFDGTTAVIKKCINGKETIFEKCDDICTYNEKARPECTTEENGGGGTCEKFWQEWREEDRGAMWGLFPGKPAGCYTAFWVYILIVGVIIAILIIVLMLIYIKPKGRKK